MRKIVLTACLLAVGSAAAQSQTNFQTQVQGQTPETAPATLSPVTVRASITPNSTLALQTPQQTGSRLLLTPHETPASISSMDSASMAERSLTSPQDAAVRLPGISQTPAPGNGNSSLTARGFSGHNSVAQLIDGTRQMVAAGTVTYPFSTWPFESVQVLSGPASVVYGDGSMGAAVNAITKKPLWDGTQGEAFVTTGSYGLVQGGVGVRGPVNDVLAYAVYLDGERSDGYRALENVKRRNYSLALAAKPAPRLLASLTLEGGINDDARYFGTPLRDGALDKSLRRINYNVKDSVVHYEDQMWRAKVEYEASLHIKLRNELYGLSSDRHWRNTENYRLDATGTSLARSGWLEIRHNLDQTGNRFDATFDASILGMAHQVVAGVDSYHAKLLHTNDYGNAPNPAYTDIINDPHRFDRGVYQQTNPTIPRRYTALRTTAFFVENALDITAQFKLVAGLRHERMRLKNHNLVLNERLGKSYDSTTGRIGLVWTPTEDLSLYGQFATATDPLSGALALPGGGADFDLTRGRQVEAGVKGMLPSVNGEWTVAVYRIQKRNLLSRDPINPALTMQVGEQSSTGLELAFAAAPTSNWSLNANLAVLRAKYDDFNESVGGVAVSRSGNVPRNVPERTANLWTSWRFAPQWKVGGGLHYEGKRPSNTANTRWLPAYVVLDAFVSHDWSRDASIMLSVKNLGNRAYAISGNDTSWLLGPSRTVLLTLRAGF